MSCLEWATQGELSSTDVCAGTIQHAHSTLAKKPGYSKLFTSCYCTPCALEEHIARNGHCSWATISTLCGMFYTGTANTTLTLSADNQALLAMPRFVYIRI